MKKTIVHGDHVLEKMITGADKLADTVKITLGPRGRTVLISRKQAPPLITDDGAVIASEIALSDPFENIGAQIMKQAALKTNDETGDGTTTAIVLAQSIVQEGLKNIAAGADPIELRKGILAAADAVAEELEKTAVPVEGRDAIASVATISCRDHVIGGMIADAMEQIGKFGVITVSESNRMETALTVAKGMQFNRRLVTKSFLKKGEEKVRLDRPLILITDYEITKIEDLVPVLEQALDLEEPRPLLLIAEKIAGEALDTLVLNRMKDILDVVAIMPPGYGDGRREMMEDIAVLTGGTFIDKTAYKIKETTLDMLGSAAYVAIDEQNTLIVDGCGEPDAVQFRIHDLQMRAEDTEYAFKRDRYRERLARFVGGIAMIDVGGTTETEMKARKLRVDDAVNAAKAAVAKGIIPGGGTGLMKSVPAAERFAQTLEGDKRTGAAIVAHSLEEPTRLIAANAGYDGNTIAAHVKGLPPGYGFDAAQGAYADMIASGIVDPVSVTLSALRSAVSAAAVLLTAGAGVAEAERNLESTAARLMS